MGHGTVEADAIPAAQVQKIQKLLRVRLGDDVFHTYSTYSRGVEGLSSGYSFLDITPYGRQEDFEDSPPGWPQRPTYG